MWDPYHQAYINASEAVQNRAARFVKKDFRRTSSVSSMLQNLNWRRLEERRLGARLTLLYKAYQGSARIDISKFLPDPSTRRYTRQNSSVSFTRPRPSKDCYKYSFLPRTVAQWNALPPVIRDSQFFRNGLNSVNLLDMIGGALH